MASKRASSPPSQDLSIKEALDRAYAHWNAGQADQAELFCQRVLAVWPGQADASHLMGVMAHAYGKLDLALQHVRQACLAPRAPAVYFSNLAEMCRQKGLLEEGERAGRQAVAITPDLVAGWNNLGIILQEAGKYEESAACLERVVGLQPDYAEAHNNLGNTFKRMGRLDRAETHYGRALALFPNYAEAHSNLANLFNDLGQFDRAVAEARLAIELNPRLADAYINLAGIEIGRYRYAEALRWLNALLAFAPVHAGGLSARGSALKELGRLDEALDCARRAVAAAPESAEAHNSLGQILQALNRFEDAAACFERAIALPGTAAEDAVINRATMLMEIGRQDEARAAFNSIAENSPRFGSIWLHRAELKTFAADDPDLGRMLALLRPDGAQSFSDRLSLHFALGKAYLDAGDDERAFHHLNEGNRLKRATLSYDGEATAAWMRSIADTFSPARLRMLQGVGCSSAQPVFVIGMPRSGTTLVEQILASHPQVHGAGELPTLRRLVEGLGDYPTSLDHMARDGWARLGESYTAQVAALAEGRRHVVDKMPANFLHAGLIHLILPEARIIHCRRDPVDTCLSCYTKMFQAEQVFAYDMGELGRFYRAYEELMDHWREVLPENRFIEVTYETVVADLPGQARRMIEFLGLPWDESCLRFHESKRVVRTSSLNQVRRPIYTSSVSRWKKHARHLGPLVEALGIDAP